jgi:hypothetical protein
MIVRDHNGEIILSACRHLVSCRDALAAELKALLEGISLSWHWCNKPVLIEVDCLEIINLVNNKEVDRSVFSTTIGEIKTVLNVR